MIELLIGPIASGKSTYARSRAKMGAVVVSSDDITNAVHAGQYVLYSRRLEPLYKGIEIAMITQALALGLDVVVDRTNRNPAMRRRYIGLAHPFDTQVVGVVFEDNGPEEHARRRAGSDGRGRDYEYWLKAAKAHAEKAIPPQMSEGFTTILPVPLAWEVAQLSLADRTRSNPQWPHTN